jgi:hypothetical protein
VLLTSKRQQLRGFIILLVASFSSFFRIICWQTSFLHSLATCICLKIPISWFRIHKFCDIGYVCCSWRKIGESWCGGMVGRYGPEWATSRGAGGNYPGGFWDSSIW